MYGENGSGKSSIYWALYTLLACSEKNDITKIRKYFEKSNKESLVNIYATVAQNGIGNSFIKFDLNDNSVFEVSYQNQILIKIKRKRKSFSKRFFKLQTFTTLS